VAIFVNSERKIIAWTDRFDNTANSAFSQTDIEDFLTQAILDQLKKGQSVHL
jgi:hypothetical protein